MGKLDHRGNGDPADATQGIAKEQARRPPKAQHLMKLNTANYILLMSLASLH